MSTVIVRTNSFRPVEITFKQRGRQERRFQINLDRPAIFTTNNDRLIRVTARFPRTVNNITQVYEVTVIGNVLLHVNRNTGFELEILPRRTRLFRI